MSGMPKMLDRMAELIAIPSVSSARPDLDQPNLNVIDRLAEWAEEIGFRCEIDPIRPGKANLIARLGSSRDADAPGGLVLSGHTDTVPTDPNLWSSDPWVAKLRDDRLYGLGACDMKGFFALALEAAGRFRPEDLAQPLILIGTADEESSMSGARQLLASSRQLGRQAVIGEPTGLLPIRMHKGVMMETLRVRGRSGHSSDPKLGVNAIEGMMEILKVLKTEREALSARFCNPAFKVKHPTLNFGAIHGGDNPNRICGCCEVHIDIRPLPGMTIESTRDWLEDSLRNVLDPETGLSLEIESLFPGVPPFETPKDAPLTRFLEETTGHAAGAVAFGTEGPFFRELGLDTMILGAGDIARAHQPDEFLALSEIGPAVSLFERLIDRFCCSRA